MLNRLYVLAATLSLAIAADSFALAAGEPDPLFRDDTAIEIRITAPMDTLLGERPNVRYLRGAMSYEDLDKGAIEFDIGIRTRGNFRRQSEVCPFPPLRINLKKSQAKGTLFDKQSKLKLVAHCRDASDRYEQNVIKEYLAYRMLNTLTDISYRVRLARITYVDSEQKHDDRVRYGFFIEHKKGVSRRLGLPVISTEKIRTEDLQGPYSDLTSLFQFLIANTDFSPIAGPKGEDCCHNSTLFGKEGEPIYAVPYDFDMSGLVNAPYAEPNPRFGIKRVTQRHYRGRCAYIGNLPETVKLFEEKRADIYGLIEGQAELESSTRKSVTKFIDRFYDVIGNPKKRSREIESRCI